MSTTNYRNRQEKAKTYLYNISTAFDKLVIEREVKNTSLSKELIAKVKRTRKSQDNDHYIFYTLGKLNLLSEENIKILEKEPYFFDTLKIVMPIHAELGRKFFDQEVDSIKNDSDGNVCEKNELSTEESKNDNIKIHSEENKDNFLQAKINFGSSLGRLAKNLELATYEKIEKKFLQLLEIPMERLEINFYSLISSISSLPGEININWNLLYEDIYKWDKSNEVKYKWAKEFYKYYPQTQTNKTNKTK